MHTDNPGHQQRRQRNQQTENQAEPNCLSHPTDRRVVHHPEMVQEQRNTERQLKTSVDPIPYLDFVAELAGRSDDYRMRVIMEPS